MVDFTQNLTNAVQVFGPADTENWGTLEWGTDDWAIDDDLEFTIEKVLANTCTASDAVYLETIKTITSPVSVADSFISLTHQDAAGYIVIYPSDSENVVSAVSGVFTKVAIGSDAFTTQAITSTSWSIV